MNLVTIAYATNIFILAPIVFGSLFRFFPADQNRFVESEGWRLLVGSLWSAILILSMVGLWKPEAMIPILMLQVIYKSIWLLLYAVPRLRGNRFHEIPLGIFWSFIFIVLTWPWIIPWTQLF